MKKSIKESCLIELQKGDAIQERERQHRIGVMDSIHLVPNSKQPNSELVCIVVMLYIDPEKGAVKISATSDHFQAYDKYEYEEYYPSQM